MWQSRLASSNAVVYSRSGMSRQHQGSKENPQRTCLAEACNRFHDSPLNRITIKGKMTIKNDPYKGKARERSALK